MITTLSRKMGRKILAIGTTLSLCIVFSLPLYTAFAAVGDCTNGQSGCTYVPLATIPGAITAGQATDPAKVVTNIYGVSIALASVLAVAMIIWAGIEYATVESIAGHSDAKDRLWGAVFGLILLLSSYLILRTININLVKVDLSLGTPIVGNTQGNNLDAVLVQANASVQALEQARAAVQTATTQVDAAQKALTLAQSGGNAATIAAAQATLDSAKANLQSLTVTEKQSALTTTFDQGKLQINSLLKASDISGAQAKAQAVSDQIDKNLNDLKASNPSASALQTAQDQATVTKTLNQQDIIAAQNYSSVEYYLDAFKVRAIDQSEADSRAATLADASIKAHQDFLTAVTKNLAQLKASGVSADALEQARQSSLAQLNALDSKLPITQQCPSGNYTYSGTSIVCN